MDYDEPSIDIGRIFGAVQDPRQRLLKRVENMQRELESLQRKLLRLDRLPTDDPCRSGEVLFIKRKFNNSPREYSYAAIKVGGKYYLTGKDQNSYYWNELLIWLTKDGGDVLEMRKMQELDNILDPNA